jgi:hypothetical protein
MARRKKQTDQPPADDQAAEIALTAPQSPPSPAVVLQVKQWVVEGQQAADILESIGQHFPDEARDALLGAALAELGQEAQGIDQDLARGFLLNAYREVYRRGLEINDFGTALAALRSFERVTGC